MEDSLTKKEPKESLSGKGLEKMEYQVENKQLKQVSEKNIFLPKIQNIEFVFPSHEVLPDLYLLKLVILLLKDSSDSKSDIFETEESFLKSENANNETLYYNQALMLYFIKRDLSKFDYYYKEVTKNKNIDLSFAKEINNSNTIKILREQKNW